MTEKKRKILLATDCVFQKNVEGFGNIGRNCNPLIINVYDFEDERSEEIAKEKEKDVVDGSEDLKQGFGHEKEDEGISPLRRSASTMLNRQEQQNRFSLQNKHNGRILETYCDSEEADAEA